MSTPVRTRVVVVNTLGPKGDTGAMGPIGPSGSVETGSFATTGSNIFIGNQIITGSLNVTSNITGTLIGTSSWSNNSLTASYINNLNQNVTITGSLTITQNLNVLGSSSIVYITSSQLNVGNNLITVNTNTPGVRFGGLAVIDSGSSPQVSGSLLFDSRENRWIYIHQGAAVTSSILLMGPETINNLGNETRPTTNRILKSLNEEHAGDSNITDTGTVVSINSNAQITGSLRGNVPALTISSNTASMNLNVSNFFTLQLVASTNTYINLTNIQPGQVTSLLVSTTGSATVSFPNIVLQPSGAAYIPTTTTGKDILTFISYDTTNLYLANVKNLI